VARKKRLFETLFTCFYNLAQARRRPPEVKGGHHEAARPVGTLWQRLPSGARGLTLGDIVAPSTDSLEQIEEKEVGYICENLAFGTLICAKFCQTQRNLEYKKGNFGEENLD
jgi:hypothetical protein